MQKISGHICDCCRKVFYPEERVYESDVLFPVFASRLPDRKRRDIDKILEKWDEILLKI